MNSVIIYRLPLPLLSPSTNTSARGSLDLAGLDLEIHSNLRHSGMLRLWHGINLQKVGPADTGKVDTRETFIVHVSIIQARALVTSKPIC